MTQSIRQVNRFSFSHSLLLACCLLFLILIPLALSNYAAGTICGSLLLIVIFFFPGYLLLRLLPDLPAALRLVLSPVFGLALITNLYDIFAHASATTYFSYLVMAASVGGIVCFVLDLRRASARSSWSADSRATALAGAVVALFVSPVFWRSGRFSADEFVFHGPAGQDQLFHVTLLQRLANHVPPDNFIVSGLNATVYHYFGDLAQAMVFPLEAMWRLPATDLFDLYYRCYPTLIYFLIGALAYLAGQRLLGTTSGGRLAVLLLLGAGGLGLGFGILQTVAHPSLSAMREHFFSTWTIWDGVDAIRPLVHRPAHYHGLLISLAAINLLLRPERGRRDWILAGLLLGLMAGFNFTLAATLGAAAVISSLLMLLRAQKDTARDLATLAFFLFIGSLPLNARMFLSGFHSVAPGFPFRGPSLEFSTATWGGLLGRVVPSALVPWAALILLPVVAYGIKLFGLPPMTRLNLGEEKHRGLATLFAITFAISFVIGVFFPFQGIGASIIFIQPSIWILALFALQPIGTWLGRNGRTWCGAALWGLLALTWVQALASFNFSSEAVFSRETVRAFNDLRNAAAPDDVVAYLPSELTERPIWGADEQSTNFSIIAMTGLDGYVSSEPYTRFSAAPGLSGRSSAEILAKAEHLYEQRRDDVTAFISGNITPAASARLTQDHVRWIVISGSALRSVSTTLAPWRQTREIVVYRLAD